MDLNLHFWRSEGKTFSQRFHHWVNILDPLLLFSSRVEIEKSRTLLQASEEKVTESLQDKKLKEAWKLSLSSVNPVTGNIIPVIFRPPAFMPFAAPLAVATFSPHRGAKQAFLWQFIFHVYTGGFNLANGNPMEEASGNSATESKKFQYLLLTTAAVSYCAFVGALPQLLITRYKLQSPPAQLIMKTIVPGPLTAVLCAFNLLVLRSIEADNGIEVMDSNGNVVGVSKRAGEKAIKETALSRAAVFGSAVLIPDVALHYLKRMSVLLRNPYAVAPLRSSIMILILGVMIPVSFSWMPQIGKIKRSELEPEIVPATEETEFFYNRGI